MLDGTVEEDGEEAAVDDPWWSLIGKRERDRTVGPAPVDHDVVLGEARVVGADVARVVEVHAATAGRGCTDARCRIRRDSRAQGLLHRLQLEDQPVHFGLFAFKSEDQPGEAPQQRGGLHGLWQWFDTEGPAIHGYQSGVGWASRRAVKATWSILPDSVRGMSST